MRMKRAGSYHIEDETRYNGGAGRFLGEASTTDSVDASRVRGGASMLGSSTLEIGG